MNIHHPHAHRSAQEYTRTGRALEVLGWGVSGMVYVSPIRATAVKVHLHAENFRREAAAYHRLQGRQILDFASSFLVKPDFSEEIMSGWWETVEERFGDKFSIVQKLYTELVLQAGIYYLDLKPGNIEFADSPSPP